MCKKDFSAPVEQAPDPGTHGAVRWRRVDLQHELKTQFGIEVHERTFGSYLAKLSYRRLSVRSPHPDADLEAQVAYIKISLQSWNKRSPKRLPENLSKSSPRACPRRERDEARIG
jgi:Winged helix-turn helix